MTNRIHTRIERIVVGVDFTDASTAVARWVARSFAPSAEIVLVHGIYAPQPPGYLKQLYPPPHSLIDAARAGAGQRLRALGHSLDAGLIWPEVRIGKPEEVITAVADDYGADMIVVGAHVGATGLRARLGTTAERVLRRATRPVLVARGALQQPPRCLIAALDGSDMTEPILAWTEHFLGNEDTIAMLLHVLPQLPISAPSMVGGLPPDDRRPDEQGARLQDATDWLDDERRALHAPRRIATEAVIGDPAAMIVKAASRYDGDLIVVGNRGAGAVERFLFGSVAEEVLVTASCSVLVVRGVDDGARHGARWGDYAASEAQLQ